jgi:hypothetical protein
LLSSILYPRSSILVLGLFLAFLAIYIRTAAPSVLSGDSAEFQMAAPLLGVPHPTTYPLYTLLGKLATLLIPFGDMAYRVTLVSAGAAAGAVAIFFLLARRVTGSTPAALVAALALGVTPGLWNAATLAEVYALLALLLVGLGYSLTATSDEPEQRTKIREQNMPQDVIGSTSRSFTRSGQWQLRKAAFVAGLGFTHHGLFAIVGLPVFAGYVLWLLARRPAAGAVQIMDQGPRTKDQGRITLIQLALLALCFAAGMTPWLYPLVQYAHYGPFDGMDYGLPQHYFWGAPTSWGQTLGLLAGGQIARGIFRIPSPSQVIGVIWMIGRRLGFEFGIVGCALGLIGFVALLRRNRGAWLGAAWVFGATLLYLLLLGPAVEDAPVFTLPLLLPWALWIAVAVESIIALVRRPTSLMTTDKGTRGQGEPSGINRPVSLSPGLLVSSKVSERWQLAIMALIVAATLAWGYTRVPYSSKRQLWLFREFGQAALQELPPQAVVIAHWEQGMTLQYLRLVEGQRPDVWVDVVEPNDQAWDERARRYSGRPVFFVGDAADVAGLPVELVREAEYTDLFRLRR